jgi:hypothetical protein
MATKYYLYWYSISKEIPAQQFYTISYDKLITDPKEVINTIYRHFNLEIRDEFNNALEEMTGKSKKYRSKHSYSMEQYGLSEKETYTELKRVFERYHFEAN